MATTNVYNTESSKTIGKNDVMNVYGWAFSNTIQAGGTMSILSSGSGSPGSGTWNTISNGGVMIVGSKALAKSTTVSNGGLMIVSGYQASADTVDIYNAGSMVLSYYGVASRAHVSSGGKMTVSQYSSAFDCSVLNGGSMVVMSYGSASNCSINEGGSMTVSSGGKVSSASIYNKARVDLSSGSACYTKVYSGGFLYVFSGGWSDNAILQNEARLIVGASGSTLGTLISSGAKMYVSGYGESLADTVYSGGTMVVSKGGSADYTTVSSGGTMIIYGSAYELTAKKGTVLIKNGATVEFLTNKGADIQLEKGAEVISCKGDPLKMPDCDDGKNKYLYNKKEKDELKLNTSLVDPAGQKITSTSPKEISVDQKGTVSLGVYSNYVGYGDETDFTKITLDHAARLSFILNATGATKITIWSLTEGKDKKGNTTYSTKALQATAAKLDKKTATYQATTKGLLLDKGDYYICVESTNAKKGGNAYYNVELNKGTGEDKSKIFDNANSKNTDDWDDMKSKGPAGKVGNYGILNGSKESLYSDWVGFGDTVDCRKFTLASAAKLNFTIESGDIVKFSICQLIRKEDKKGNVTYSLKTLQTVTTKKAAGGTSFSASTRDLFLEKNEDGYYFCVESANAKKGGDASYTLKLDKGDGKTHFFDSAKSSSNDDWDDMKTNGPTGKVVTVGEISTKNLDKVILNDWVGYGDEVDYRRFSIKTNAKISFSIQCDDATKFTVYRLISKTDKKGNTTYSLKALQSTNFKGGADRTETKLLKLETGDDYCFSMQSTNAKKGGDATYSIYLEQFNVLEGKDGAALTGPEEINGWNDAEAATPADPALPGNTASLDTQYASAADSVQNANAQENLFAGLESVQAVAFAAADNLSPDFTSEHLFGDSAGGFLASL